MIQEICIISGGNLFSLEIEALKGVRKKESTTKKVSVNPDLNFDFSALRKYCEKKGIIFDKSSSSRFSFEGGNGFYITSDSKRIEDSEELKRRGFYVGN